MKKFAIFVGIVLLASIVSKHNMFRNLCVIHCLKSDIIKQVNLLGIKLSALILKLSLDA